MKTRSHTREIEPRVPPGSETDYDQRPAWDAEADPVPAVDSDQRQSW